MDESEGGPLALYDPERRNPFLTGEYERLAEEVGALPGRALGPSWGPDQEIRRQLEPGERVACGELLEVEIELDAAHDCDYVVIEDIKPSGCEAEETDSGRGAVPSLPADQVELRDEKVVFFCSFLPAGRTRVVYRLRAEAPGHFHVLPTHAYAMYAPEIRALSDELRLDVQRVQAPETPP